MNWHFPMAFSGHQVLPHLSALQHQLLRGLEDQHERFRSAYFDLELLPYALGAAWHALSEFARIQREILAEYPHDRLSGLAFLALGPQQRDLLSYMFDNFLEAARRAQNAVIHYLSRGLRRSRPASLHDLVHAMRRGKVALPQAPEREILNYWDKHGQRLKDYRDLAQHHALVTSDARVMGSAEGRVGLYLLLPSNPEVKSAGKLSFGHPEVHAFPYAKQEFKILLVFLDWLTKGLVTDPPESRSQTALHVFRDPAQLGRGVSHRAYVPPAADKLQAEIRDVLEQLRPERPCRPKSPVELQQAA